MNKFYIGSTKRQIRQRLNEHIKNWMKLEEKTALIEYCKKSNNVPDWENIELLQTSTRENKIRIVEKVIIEKKKKKERKLQYNHCRRTSFPMEIIN